MGVTRTNKIIKTDILDNNYIFVNQIFNIKKNYIVKSSFLNWKLKSKKNIYLEFKLFSEKNKLIYLEDNESNIKLITSTFIQIMTQYILMILNITKLVITNILDSQLFYDFFSNLSKKFIKYNHYYLHFIKYFYGIFDKDFLKKVNNIILKCKDIYNKNMIEYMNSYKYN